MLQAKKGEVIAAVFYMNRGFVKVKGDIEGQFPIIHLVLFRAHEIIL